MEQLSLIDKFKVLFDNIFEHPLFIILLLVPAIIFLLQKKHGQKAFVFVYLLVIIFVLYIGGEVIFELFDNLMNGLFMTLYFPNFITLFVVVVLCSIIALISFFSKKMYKINKIINITAFAIIQMLFVLTLTVIKSNNINIYADNALYSNNDVLTLMQLLIGCFALQVIAILIINGINKVTDILDKRSTPLGEDIHDQIVHLEKTKNNLSLIKNIKIDNTKIGYINVADKSKTSKPKLKPFKFDVDKLESITLNVPEEPTKTLGISLEESKPLEEVLTVNTSSVQKPKVESKIQKVKNHLKKKPKKRVLLPEEKSSPIFSSKLDKKPDLFKPMDLPIDDKVIHDSKFINKTITDNNKPNLLRSEKLANNSIQVLGEVSKPKLVRKDSSSTDLVSNLNILDIQSTLDTAIKYKLMKGVHLKVVDDDVAVENLQIPNFDSVLEVFSKYKLYKKN